MTKLSYDDIPEPDVLPEPIDPELERLLNFFIQKNRRLAWMHGGEEIDIVVGYKQDPFWKKSGVLISK